MDLWPTALLLLYAMLSFETTDGRIVMFPYIQSHFDLMEILAKELYDRGYDVTMVAPSICFNGRDFKYNTISYSLSGGDFNATSGRLSLPPSRAGTAMFNDLWKSVRRSMIQQSEFIMKALRKFEFQIAIVDSALFDALYFTTELNIPHIMFACSRFDIHHAKVSDVSLLPSYLPVGRQHYGYTHRMNFYQRIANFWMYYQQVIVIKYIREAGNRLRTMYIPELAEFDTESALKKTTLWINNSDFGLEFPYRVMPRVKYVGSLTARPSTGLSGDLAEFVSGSKEDGVILVSFSTFYPAIDSEIEAKLLEAFSSFPQRVLWRTATNRSDSDKIKFVKRIPQNDVLGSPKVRAFVSHGGLNGVQEAMYHGVPMVILPIFGDQPDCAVRVEAHGYGVRLDPFDFTTSSIVDALNAVLYDRRYAEKMKSVSEMVQFQHSHGSGREMAAYWVEHAMKFGHNYIAPVKNLNYIQCNYLDVIGLVVVLCLLLIFVVYKIFRTAANLLHPFIRK